MTDKQESFQGGSELPEIVAPTLNEFFIQAALEKYQRDTKSPEWLARICWHAGVVQAIDTADREAAAKPHPASVESFQGMLTKWRKSHEEPYQPAYDDCAKDAQLLFTRLVELRDELRAIGMTMGSPDDYTKGLKAAYRISAAKLEALLFTAAQLTELIEGPLTSGAKVDIRK